MAQNLRLQVMLNAVDRVTGPLKRIRQGAGETAQAMRETRDRLKTLQATQKDISSFRALKSQSESTARAMREQQDRIRRLSHQMQTNQGDTAALANERRKAILQARQLSQRYDSERQKLQRLRTSLNNNGVSTHNLSQDQQRLANEIRQANQQMETQKRKLQRIAEQQRRAAQASEQYQRSLSRGQSIAGAGAMGAAVGTAGVVAMGTQALMNQSSGARLAAQQGEGNEEAIRYREVITQVYTTGRGQGLDQVIEAVSVLASQFESLGATTNEELGAITQQALTLTDTFNIDLAEAAQTAGIMVKNGLATNATEAFDLMARGMQEVSASMRHELPEILHEYGTNFRALGFDGKESLNMLVAAAEQGRFALDKTGDALKEFTIRGSDMSKASVEAYDAIGLNAQEMADAIAGGGDRAGAALTTTAQRLLEIENPAQRANAAIALFGTPIEDLSIDQIPAFLRGLAQTNDRMGEFSGTAREMSATLDNNAGDSLKRVQRALGGAFMGVLDEVDDTIIRVSNNITSWMKANPELTSTLTKAAIAIAAVTAVGGSLLMVLGSIIGPLALMKLGVTTLGIKLGWLTSGFSGIGTALASMKTAMVPMLGALKGLGVAIMATPIGWLVAGIAALIAAGLAIYKYWEPIKAFFIGFWQGLKDAMGPAVSEIGGAVSSLLSIFAPFQPMFDLIVQTVKSVWGWFTQLLAPVELTADQFEAATNAGRVFGEALGGLINIAANVSSQFVELGVNIVQGLVNGILSGIQRVIDAVTALANSIINWFTRPLEIHSPSRVFEGFGINIVEGMINGIASMAGALRDQVMGMAANIAGWVQEAMASAWDSIGNGASRAMQWGRDTAAGMGQGIRDGASRATESAANLASGVTDTVRGWLDIHSPSRVFATIGGYISQGLANGIENDADNPVKQVRSVASRMSDAAAGLMLSAGIASPAVAIEAHQPELPQLPELHTHIERPKLPTLKALQVEHPTLPELSAPEIQRPELPEMPRLMSEVATPETPTLDALRIERPTLPALPNLGALQIQQPALPKMPRLISEVVTPETPTLDTLRIERPSLPTLPSLGALQIQPPTLPALPTLYSEVTTPETPTLNALRIERPTLPVLPSLGALQIQQPALPEMPRLMSEVATPETPILDALHIEQPTLSSLPSLGALEIQQPALPEIPTLYSEVATPETPTLDALHIERPELPPLPSLGALQIQQPALPEMPHLMSEVAAPETPTLDALRIERPELPALPELGALEISVPEMPRLMSEVATPETPTLDALRIERPELPALPELGALEISVPEMPRLISEVTTPEIPTLDALRIEQPTLPALHSLGALEIHVPEMPRLMSEVATPEIPTLDAMRIKQPTLPALPSLGALQIQRPELPSLKTLAFEWPELPQFDPLRIDTSGVQIDARPPLQSHTSQPSSGLVINGGINIEINAAPGMNEQDLARLVNAEVQRALRDAECRAQASRRSAFHDID